MRGRRPVQPCVGHAPLQGPRQRRCAPRPSNALYSRKMQPKSGRPPGGRKGSVRATRSAGEEEGGCPVTHNPTEVQLLDMNNSHARNVKWQVIPS